MPSSTETAWRPGRLHAWRDAVRDLGHLLAFTGRTVRKPRAVRIGLVVLVGCTLLFAFAPLGVEPGDGPLRDPEEMGRALTYALPAFLLLALGASMGGGGGRELLPRDQAWVHPVSPLTEHLGSLVLAPFNLAWLLQWWGLMAITALLVEPSMLLGSHLLIGAWVVCATAIGQALGWVVEGVRRLPYGVLAVRVVGLGVVAGLGAMQVGGQLATTVAALPTAAVVEAIGSPRWAVTALVLLVVAAFAVVAGGWTATWALSLPGREEMRVESGVHPARRLPRSWVGSPDAALLRRMDRASVWRSVGMRRGLMVLGTGPGVVAVVGGMTWDQVMVLPGLAASGAALLFGVNAWCLDGRGAVWRETLPVAPEVTFAARTRVLAECLVAVAATTTLLAGVRNGLPNPGYALALGVLSVVVVLQVVATSMRWSVHRPIAVNLSSPRATPAPPATMLGYAAKLSLTTTLTGLLFGGLGLAGVWWLTLTAAVPLLAWSCVRLWLARRRWLDHASRAQIALTVVP